jgi:hypothetical protein
VATKRQCDVSACAAAHHSFRESDCTYQPFEGERRVCVAPPSAQQRSADRGPRREADPPLARAARDPDRNVDWRATSHTRGGGGRRRGRRRLRRAASARPRDHDRKRLRALAVMAALFACLQ